APRSRRSSSPRSRRPPATGSAWAWAPSASTSSTDGRAMRSSRPPRDRIPGAMSETSIERLASIGLSDGEAALSWFGQASFAARGGGTTVLLDPFLSPYDGRLHDSPLAPGECVGIDVVLCSHEHVDHLDVPSIDPIATASPGAVFVVPSPIVDMVTEAGVPPDRVVGMQPGGSMEIGGLTVRAVPACHGVTMDDAYGFGESLSGGMVRFLGFVIDLG